MFPIDDGSMPEFNVTSEEHVAQLKSEREWLLGYREGVRLALAAWGWDTSHEKRIVPIQQGMGWTHWDIRLSKIIRSLFLFEETQLLNSVQAFARELQKNEKKQEGFFYGRINLQELLYFQLPRRVHEPHEEAKELNASDGCIADHDGSNGAGAAAAAPVGAITGAAADAECNNVNYSPLAALYVRRC